MTLRAFIIGLISVSIIAAICFFNDAVLYQTLLIGTHMPTSVFGVLVPAMLLVNPLLGLLHRRTRLSLLRPFSARELCLILALILPACCIPYCSFMRLLPRAAMLSHFYAQKEPAWKLEQTDGTTIYATRLVPEKMLADPTVDNDNALTGFVQGLSPKSGHNHIEFSAVPWKAWRKPLLFWLPVFMTMWTALTGLAMVCHHQWANNEHLPYPVVQFAQALLPDEKSNRLSSIFHNKFFWIATVFVLFVHLNNTLVNYYPEYLIPVERNFNFLPLRTLFQNFTRGGGWPLYWIRIYFSVIAIAYLLPTDVSLAVGLGPFLCYWITGLLANWGIAFRSGAEFSTRMDYGALLGGYIAFFCIMLYNGRHYYWNSFRRSLGLGGFREIPDVAVWGMRVFLIGIIAFIIIIASAGLDWQLAVFFSILAVIVYLVLGRIIAETGLFYLSPHVYPPILIVGLLGEQALGPSTLAVIFLLTTLLFNDTRETFMPYMVNAMRFAEHSRTRHTRFFPMLAVIMIVCLAIAVPVAIYFCYDGGTNWRDGFATSSVPRTTFTSALAARRTLIAQGVLEHAESVSGFERFLEMKPNPNFFIAFGITFLGVLIFSAARLHWAKWPLHPVIFCIWPGYASYMMAWSFILGGITKILVNRFGGSHCYQELKPLMFGLVAGDMIAGLLVIASGIIYYFCTGEPPKCYYVLPG